MIIIKHKIAGIPVNDILFNTDKSLKNIFAIKSYRHVFGSLRRPLFSIKQTEYTLLTKLTQFNDDELLMQLNTDCRNHVRKGMRLGISCIYDKEIAAFYPTYASFASGKDLTVLPVSTFQILNQHLVFSRAVYTDKILATHCHIIDAENKTARLFCSASPRLDNDQDYALIGYANKLLTFQDMLYFKRNGFIYYDFGGYAHQTTDKQLQGINQYKKKFGGQLQELFTYYTLPYYILNKMSAWKRKVNNFKTKVSEK